MTVPAYLPYVLFTGNALSLVAIFYGLNKALADASWPRPERLRAVTVSAAILLGWLAVAFGLHQLGWGVENDLGRRQRAGFFGTPCR